MGNSNSNEALGFRQPSGCWVRVGFDQDSEILLESTTGIQVQQYYVPANLRPQEQMQLYMAREQPDSNVVRVLYASALPAANAPFVCTSNTMYRVWTERIPFRLSDLPLLSAEEGMTLLLGTLRGFQNIQRYCGPFRVTAPMIGINCQGKAKVWLNENFAEERIATERVSEKDMVAIITHLISQHLKQAFPSSVNNKIIRGVLFSQAIAVVSSYFLSNNLKLVANLTPKIPKQPNKMQLETKVPQRTAGLIPPQRPAQHRRDIQRPTSLTPAKFCSSTRHLWRDNQQEHRHKVNNLQAKALNLKQRRRQPPKKCEKNISGQGNNEQLLKSPVSRGIQIKIPAQQNLMQSSTPKAPRMLLPPPTSNSSHINQILTLKRSLSSSNLRSRSVENLRNVNSKLNINFESQKEEKKQLNILPQNTKPTKEREKVLSITKVVELTVANVSKPNTPIENTLTPEPQGDSAQRAKPQVKVSPPTLLEVLSPICRLSPNWNDPEIASDQQFSKPQIWTNSPKTTVRSFVENCRVIHRLPAAYGPHSLLRIEHAKCEGPEGMSCQETDGSVESIHRQTSTEEQELIEQFRIPLRLPEIQKLSLSFEQESVVVEQDSTVRQSTLLIVNRLFPAVPTFESRTSPEDLPLVAPNQLEVLNMVTRGGVIYESRQV